MTVSRLWAVSEEGTVPPFPYCIGEQEVGTTRVITD